ncbi:hypothetical protein N8D56_14310 [Devosia sp. A8/3-2]|nr:hypothetical protein N8D56_14310 [Devosia sp. A8/3-2]
MGFKLPGLEFQNQRVEAAFRKELVYGEDHNDRAQPAPLQEFFLGVQRNYFRLYGHYLYFNVAGMCTFRVRSLCRSSQWRHPLPQARSRSAYFNR